jgi:hypothetical protein
LALADRSLTNNAAARAAASRSIVAIMFMHSCMDEETEVSIVVVDSATIINSVVAGEAPAQ